MVDIRPMAKVSAPGDVPGPNARRLAAADANADDAMQNCCLGEKASNSKSLITRQVRCRILGHDGEALLKRCRRFESV